MKQKYEQIGGAREHEENLELKKVITNVVALEWDIFKVFMDNLFKVICRARYSKINFKLNEINIDITKDNAADILAALDSMEGLSEKQKLAIDNIKEERKFIRKLEQNK